ncbi:MAG: transcriptional repressor [Candidatus Thorarchaeota archaeon]
MPPESLTTEKLLEILYIQQKLWENEESVAIDLQTIEKEIEKEHIEASTRTIYRKLQDLRKENLINQSIGYFRKYELIEYQTGHDHIIVDKEGNRISKKKFREIFKANRPMILSEKGEIKTQLFELTDKGKKLLNIEGEI